MDVSTAILDDDRFQRLARYAPDHFEAAFTGYMAALARSWRKGRRVSIEAAWPVYRPIDQLAIAALAHVGLIDDKGLIRSGAWRQWFAPALIRRDSNRERWRRDKANERARQQGVSSESARTHGNRPSVPTVPTVPPAGPIRLAPPANYVEPPAGFRLPEYRPAPKPSKVGAR